MSVSTDWSWPSIPDSGTALIRGHHVPHTCVEHFVGTIILAMQALTATTQLACGGLGVINVCVTCPALNQSLAHRQRSFQPTDLCFALCTHQALHSITSAVCEHTVQEDDRVAQRYLVEASYVMQAQQRQHIEIGTREGLKALLDQLYLGPDRVSCTL